MNNNKFCLAVSAQKLAARTSWALVPHLTPSAFLFEEVTPFLCVMISPSVQLCPHADMLGGLDSFREEIAERKNAFLLLNMIKTLLFYTFCTIRNVVFRNRYILLSSLFLNSTGNSPIVATFLAKLNKRGHFWNISKTFSNTFCPAYLCLSGEYNGKEPSSLFRTTSVKKGVNCRLQLFLQSGE